VEGSRHQLGHGSGDFPPMPYRKCGVLRQGAERENDRPHGWFPITSAKCQYENVLALLVVA